MNDVSIIKEFVPRYNGYKCTSCGGIYLTVDVDPGTTPMFMSCFIREDCGSRAVSMGYPKGTPPMAYYPLLFEFYKPSKSQIKKIQHAALKDHLTRGGLMRRAVDTAPDWVKRLA